MFCGLLSYACYASLVCQVFAKIDDLQSMGVDSYKTNPFQSELNMPN